MVDEKQDEYGEYGTGLPWLDHADNESPAEKIERLKRLSKPLYELVVTERLQVNKVVVENLRGSEVLGVEKLLCVASDKKGQRRSVAFYGHSPVLAGQTIEVKIPRYQEIREKPWFEEDKAVFYIPRDISNAEWVYETAIEISILSDDGRVLRTDRSSDYEDFVNNRADII